jgi:solute carrier family 25 protein 33/36
MHFIAGAIGGSVAAIITNPLEVIKTRLQADASSQFLLRQKSGDFLSAHSKTWNVGVALLRSEGARGFWRGMIPTLVGVAPGRAIHFATYRAMKNALNPEDRPDSWSNIISSTIAGCAVAVATSPVWVVKTRLQLDNTLVGRQQSGESSKRVGTLNLISNIYRQEGLSAFYKGLSVSLWATSEGTIQFALYERFRVIARDRLSEGGLDQSRGAVSPSQLFWCAALSKLIAATIVYPLEVSTANVYLMRL